MASSEYSLTYDGKPFVTLKADYEMEPGEAFAQMMIRLQKHLIDNDPEFAEFYKNLMKEGDGEKSI